LFLSVNANGKTLTLSEVVGITIILILAMIALAYVWNDLKTRNLKYARWVQYSLLVIVIAVFFLKEY